MILNWKLRKLKSWDCDTKNLGKEFARKENNHIYTFLTKKLQNKNESVQLNTAKILGHMKTKNAIDILLEFFIKRRSKGDFNSIRVHKETASILATLGLFQIMEILIFDLENGDENVREAAAISLGNYNTNEVFELILDALNREKNFNVYWNITRNLGEKKIPEIIPYLINCTSNIHRSYQSVEMINKILNENIEYVPENILKSIVQLENVKYYYASSGIGYDGISHSISGARDLDCTAIKKLAEDELNKRSYFS